MFLSAGSTRASYDTCFLIPACFLRSSTRPIMRSVLSPRRSGICVHVLSASEGAVRVVLLTTTDDDDDDAIAEKEESASPFVTRHFPIMQISGFPRRWST